MGTTIQRDALSLRFTRELLPDSESMLSKEWLVTNGLGGYASGTLLGIATRRYHGIFVPDLPSPGTNDHDSSARRGSGDRWRVFFF